MFEDDLISSTSPAQWKYIQIQPKYLNRNIKWMKIFPVFTADEQAHIHSIWNTWGCRLIDWLYNWLVILPMRMCCNSQVLHADTLTWCQAEEVGNTSGDLHFISKIQRATLNLHEVILLVTLGQWEQAVNITVTHYQVLRRAKWLVNRITVMLKHGVTAAQEEKRYKSVSWRRDVSYNYIYLKFTWAYWTEQECILCVISSFRSYTVSL